MAKKIFLTDFLTTQVTNFGFLGWNPLTFLKCSPSIADWSPKVANVSRLPACFWSLLYHSPEIRSASPEQQEPDPTLCFQFARKKSAGECAKYGSRQIGPQQIGRRQIGPLADLVANSAPHFLGPSLPLFDELGPGIWPLENAGVAKWAPANCAPVSWIYLYWIYCQELKNICPVKLSLVLDIFCQQLGEYMSFGGVCVPVWPRVEICSLSRICSNICMFILRICWKGIF